MTLPIIKHLYRRYKYDAVRRGKEAVGFLFAAESTKGKDN